MAKSSRAKGMMVDSVSITVERTEASQCSWLLFLTPLYCDIWDLAGSADEKGIKQGARSQDTSELGIG